MMHYLIALFWTARVSLPKLGLQAAAGAYKHDLLSDALLLDCPSAPDKAGAYKHDLLSGSLLLDCPSAPDKTEAIGRGLQA